MREINLDQPADVMPCNTFLTYGNSRSGKCVTGDTRVLAPDGRYERIDDIVRWGKFPVLGVGEAGMGGLRAVEPSHYHDMGISKIFEMVLADGRTLRGTPEHPVLTVDGYVQLAHLKEGDEVVVADDLPYFGFDQPAEWEPELMAYLIADGGLTEGTPSFTKKDLKHRDRFVHLVEMAGDSVWITPSRKGKVDSARLTGGRIKEWLSDLGLWGRPSRKKFIPSEVFTWNREALKSFLSTLFTCDGHLAVSQVAGRKYPVVALGYSSASRRLLDDVAHLLRRFGIRSRSRYVKGLLNGVEHGGYTLIVGGHEATIKFIEEIGIDRPQTQATLEQLRERVATTPGRDRGAYRDGLRVEEVKSITPSGEAHVYDLTIPGTHNFVANDMVVHNTTWAASFPRPVFFSDVSEGGWDSIANMDDNQLFEPGVKPLVWGIEEMGDMVTARTKVAPLIASGRIKTIVVDSLSFYSDLFLNFLVGLQTKKDMRSAYGDLGNHLRDLRVKTHQLGVNVVWLCLAQHPSDDVPIGRPMIPGQQGDKFMAGVHYIFHSRIDQQKQGQILLPPVYEMRTQKFQGYIAGNRLGGLAGNLPDPLVGNYETLITQLGFDANKIRQSLPKIQAVAPTRPMIQPKPPIVQARPPMARPAQAPVRPAPAPAKS